jgi:hypothetical protein
MKRYYFDIRDGDKQIVDEEEGSFRTSRPPKKKRRGPSPAWRVTRLEASLLATWLLKSAITLRRLFLRRRFADFGIAMALNIFRFLFIKTCKLGPGTTVGPQ